MPSQRRVRYVAGDIGGTNCRLQLRELRERKDGKLDEVLIVQKKFKSANYPSLQAILQEFLAPYKGSKEWPKACCLAVAGPIENNVCKATNLAGWSLVDGNQMQRELGIDTVRLLNDFEANGYGVLGLRDDEKFVINRGELRNGRPIAIIGAGTGLGEAFLTFSGKEYIVTPTEGGHTDFAPRSAIEFDLLQFIRETANVNRVSVERVVSGPGLAVIYAFLAQRFPAMVSPKVTALMCAKGADKPYIISRHAFKAAGRPFDPLCSMAHDMFESAYGAETGNLALKTLPFGGIYLCGGVSPKILWAFKEKKQFFEAFLEKGRMKANIMEKLPVYLSTNEDVGLLGSCVFSRRVLAQAGEIKTTEIVSVPVSKL